MLELGLVVGIYLLPGIIASARGIRSTGTVWLLTIFLGWTGIAWIIALVMSLTGDTKKLATDIDPTVLRYLQERDKRENGR